MIKKIVLSLITVLSFCSLALAQNKQVTGTVTDEKGEPIIGATVVAEGTSAGTTTGGDGQFTLTVPAKCDALDLFYRLRNPEGERSR